MPGSEMPGGGPRRGCGGGVGHGGDPAGKSGPRTCPRAAGVTEGFVRPHRGRRLTTGRLLPGARAGLPGRPRPARGGQWEAEAPRERQRPARDPRPGSAPTQLQRSEFFRLPRARAHGARPAAVTLREPARPRTPGWEAGERPVVLTTRTPPAARPRPSEPRPGPRLVRSCVVAASHPGAAVAPLALALRRSQGAEPWESSPREPGRRRAPHCSQVYRAGH